METCWQDHNDRRLASAHSYQQLLAVMEEVLAEIGFSEFTYAIQFPERINRPPLLVFSNFAPDWVFHYMQNNYATVDPIPTRYLHDSRPLIWSVDDNWEACGPGTRAFMDDVRQWGYYGGVAFPFCTTNLARGFCNCAVKAPMEDPGQLAAEASLFLYYVHHHVYRVYKENNPTALGFVRLTEREREVMLLVADGMTSQEIAGRLLLAKRTVDLHIMNVQEKLQADNRQQALCTAVSLGLINPTSIYGSDDDDYITYVFPSGRL